MTEYTHEGTKSWWSGNVKTLCGKTLPEGTYDSPWLSGVDCPKCKKIMKKQK